MAQVMVIPISRVSGDYGDMVKRQIRAHKFFVDIDHSDNKMEKKVRESQLAQYNYILVRRQLPGLVTNVQP